MKNLYFETRLSKGADPEFFFTKEGKAVASRSVLNGTTQQVSSGLLKEDGFQAEINISQDDCRQVVSKRIASAINRAVEISNMADAEISFNTVEKIPDNVWKNTPTEIKKFGCNPSESCYGDKKGKIKGTRTRVRSGAGHIHLSLPESIKNEKKVDLVKVLDIVCGNTCVLIDRDKGNAERRKHYGRAGEFRYKPYGLEYRVPSNFWLKDYILTSMVFALCENSVEIVRSNLHTELIDLFSENKIRRAINNNDYDLALENFRILEKFLKKHNATGVGLSVDVLDEFNEWIEMKNPLFFCDTIDKSLERWESVQYADYDCFPYGFENFLLEGHDAYGENEPEDDYYC